jgi:adenylate cyclase
VAAIATYERAAAELAAAPGASLVDRAQVLRGLGQAHAARGEVDASTRRLRQALRLLDASAADELRAAVEAELRARSVDAWLLHATGRFVGHGALDRLLADAGREGFRGEHREVVVLFSDIRGFTTLSETLEPDALVAFLNDFLTRMTWCIEEHGGSVDKFIGDAVMAVFPADGGSDAAVEAAVAMRDELGRFNRRGEIPAPLAIGVGLNAGRVVSGLIGSPQKREHTVLGDVVNTASRMEGMTKQLGASILVSEAVVARLRHPDRWLLRPLGAYAPKGRRAGVSVFDVAGERDASEASRAAQREIDAVLAALSSLKAREFDAAAAAFAALRNAADGTPRGPGYALLEHAAQAYRTTPPPADWGGEVHLSEK